MRQRSLEPEQLLVIVLPAPDLSASERLCERAYCRWEELKSVPQYVPVVLEDVQCLVVSLHTAARWSSVAATCSQGRQRETRRMPAAARAAGWLLVPVPGRVVQMLPAPRLVICASSVVCAEDDS